LEIDAVVDTGFDGWLTLPAELVTRLSLTWRRRGSALLADGNEILFDVHDGAVIWDGRTRRIPVDVAETAPLLGMGMLQAHRLVMDVERRGAVKITRLVRRRPK
jgi:clan AA aspartic protease